MILSNTEIIKQIKKGAIFIGSDPKTPIDEGLLEFDTTTLNLHLASEFISWKEFKSGARIIVDPGKSDFNFKNYAHDFTTSATKDRDGSYEVRTHEFLLCKTAEYIKLPKNIAARVEGRSSLGRLGLAVHITAPTIHAAFEGTITLEVYNHSPIPVLLRPGMKIGQLTFEEVKGKPTVGSKRTFLGQTTSIGKPKLEA